MVDRKNDFKQIFNEKFSHVVKTIMENNGKKRITQKEIADRIEEFPNVLSELLNGTRNVSLSQLGRLIYEFDLNANFFFQFDNLEEGIYYNANNRNSYNEVLGDIILDNNDIFGGAGFVQGDVYNTDSHAQSVPEKVKEHMMNVEKLKERMEGENLGLKKAVAVLEEQLKESNQLIREKDKQLFESQQELIKVYRDGTSKS